MCASCHKIFEPMGLALENFDAVGGWRTLDEGSPIDASGELVDGTKLDGVASLRGVLVRYSDQFVRVVQGITDYWFTLAVLPTQKDDG